MLKNIDMRNRHILELSLAVMYLAEGSKTVDDLCVANAEPLVLKFFLEGLRRVYDIECDRLRCELHLRADQNPVSAKRYWSRQLHLPLSNFTYVSVDKRTVGSKTYPHYKGVCALKYGNVAIQRRLVFLARFFCEQVSHGDGRVAQLVRASR